ncbi:hypothetical protein ACFW4X_10115 [Streptomyces smyrnaeus]|uniref:Secreted protein n=1 Tax=Streptomyces smyrnaeus TaxID=1387713 RepID=A0ABS3XRJ9_9ACTN|nr:hypothetical protein [Streptomyces smyrnaeus]MBO8197602.1 hypothetical protein [Streptomyces smyrnaeus]
MAAMPERPTRRIRYALLTVLAVALVAAGAVAGALTQHEDPKAPKKFSEVSGDTCHTVLLGLSDSVLDRVVPTSHYVSGWQKVTRKKDQYSSLCGIDADGKRALRVSVQQQNVAAPLRDADRTGREKAEKVPGFEESWSTRDGAAAAVPCTKKKDKDENTELQVVVESFAEKGEDVRKDLVRILKASVKTNHSLACYSAPMEDGSAYD